MTRAMELFNSAGLADRISEFDASSATVELAAQAIGCLPEHIAKSLTFKLTEATVMIVVAGDARIDNAKYKARFGKKAKMLAPDEVAERIGYPVGGVCPFGVNPGVEVYLDESLRRFDVVYAACGTANSVVRLSIPELERFSGSENWVDVCKNRPTAEQTVQN